MTKQLQRLFDTLREQLSRGVWPPTQRVLVDGYVALMIWRDAGAHVWRLRNGMRPPPMDSGMVLSSAPVRRDGQMYVRRVGRDVEWIVVARAAPLRGYDVGPGRSLGFRDPLLLYCTVDADGRLMAGYFNLREQPTPQHLRLMAGTTLSELWARNLGAEEIAVEGVRLARVLPWFFAGRLGLTRGVKGGLIAGN